MLGRNIFRIGIGFVLLGVCSVEAGAARWHGGPYHGSHVHGGRGRIGGQRWPILVGYGASGMYTPIAPILLVGPSMFFPPGDWMIGQPMMNRGPLLPPPPLGLVGRRPAADKPADAVKRGDPARSAQLMTLGDRLFRAGNFKRAEERYQQALRAAPDLAAPHVRLAQIAIARGNYSEAADRLRRAETAQPGWIITAADIQSIYSEPAAFAQTVTRLESHLQLHPDDRDAWLVLGAQWFLTGRTAKAADVFRRLKDPKRKSDVALSAFLDASNQDRAKAAEPGRDRRTNAAKPQPER